ncbi:PREDICTED: uncharacterized protein LOC108569178 [Nicrophorus vespilloides]|uniref:Uncharacterized protein LOC108569178 n=1 Tax=Nicrophorus vespilloides TaxID=110193 RepID=A0ABM1NH31_NICVS|nr:PREDICTED: uncharacterized protein LOC108569178 [Nicrophorus vespilloides]
MVSITLSIQVIAAVLVTVQSSYVHHGGVTIGITPYAHPVQSQYHAQDVFGQYTYGYSTPTSSKSETKTADGVTQGGYSYIDSNGYLQSVSYVADPIHGFRVAATNLPQDLPDVAYAKAKHLADFEAIKAEHGLARVAYSNPVAVPFGAVQPVQDLPEVVLARAQHLAAVQRALHQQQQFVPQPVQDLPEVVKARAEHLAAVETIKARDAAIRFSPAQLHGHVVPIHYQQVAPAPFIPQPSAHISYAPALSSQYHAQDNYGQYTYGYAGPLSSKSETKSADGVTKGGYSYIDANGILQTVHYVSDPIHGFRVSGSNIHGGYAA